MSDSFVSCRYPGYAARLNPDSHRECLHHSSCTWDLHYQPVNYRLCSDAVAALLQPLHMRHDSNLHLLHSRWSNLQKLANKAKLSAS